MNKKYRYISVPFLLSCSALFLFENDTSTMTIYPHSTSLIPNELASPKKSLSQVPSPAIDPDTVKVAESNKPSRWIYSRDKSVACRIKKWYSYPLESNITFEFINLRNKKPVNIVYTVLPIDKNGEVVRLFNSYIDKQSNITEFLPLLKKGQTKTFDYGRKFLQPMLTTELKGCRVAKNGEDFWTINPEQKDYEGP